MSKKCFIAKSRGLSKTDGTREDILVCYCNSTACQKIQTKYYSLPTDFSKNPINICGCGGKDIREDEVMCPKCESSFYDRLYPPLTRD